MTPMFDGAYYNFPLKKKYLILLAFDRDKIFLAVILSQVIVLKNT